MKIHIPRTLSSLLGSLLILCASRATFAWQPPDRKQPVLLAEEIRVPVNTGTFNFGQITWLPREKDQRTPRITGRVTNKAGKRSVSTKFEIQLLGDKGQPLLRSPWQESYSLEDGQTVPLFQKAPEGYGLAGLSKTDQNRISGVEIHWKKTYQFSLVKPVSSEELVVMDRDLSPRWCDGVA